MRRRLSSWLLVLSACATSPPAELPRTSEAPRPPLVLEGPGHDERRGRRCDGEEAAMGPVTVAAHWGGGWRTCRTGGSPRFDFQRVVQQNPAMRECLVRSGITWLEATVRVAASGRVASVVVEGLRPPGAPVEPCLLHVTRARLRRVGCELDHRLHFGVLP